MIALPAPPRAWALMLAGALLLGTLTLSGVHDAPLRVQLAVAVPAVILFGLPHGAADWWLAAAELPGRLPGLPRLAWIPVFGAAYGAVCAAAGFAIHWAPLGALAAFIAMSAWHFGAIDAAALGLEGYTWRAAAFGLLPVSAPLLCRGADAHAVIASLGVAVTPACLHLAAALLVALSLAAAISMTQANPARCAPLLAEAASMLVLAIAAPPLLAFLIYFCGVHAPRQAAATAARGPAWIPWLGAIAAASAIGAACLQAAATPAEVLAIRALFWGLAILTFPHVLCNWLLAPAPTSSGKLVPA